MPRRGPRKPRSTPSTALVIRITTSQPFYCLRTLGSFWRKRSSFKSEKRLREGSAGETISAEVAVHRLEQQGVLTQTQAETIQQVISLHHAACHHVLPEVPIEVMQHLLFYSCKFFRATVEKHFAGHLKTMNEHYLSLSFTDLTTYADKVQRSVSRIKKSANDKKLIWLLERGIEFDGSSYITEAQFSQKYRGKKRVLPHLSVSNFVKNTDMIRIVPVEAPRNFTADITLRKGNAADASLPVLVKRTEVEVDYPLLTRELGAQLGRTQNWVAKAVQVLNIKGDPKFHQPIRAGEKALIHRYSLAAQASLQAKLAAEPDFDPYHSK